MELILFSALMMMMIYLKQTGDIENKSVCSCDFVSPLKDDQRTDQHHNSQSF